MSVPYGQVIQNHVKRRMKDDLISLRLPELDVEAVVIVADSSIRFFDFSHDCISLSVVMDDSP
jgi:hypothetical protein